VGGVNPTIFHFDSPTNTIQLQGHTARVHDGSFSQNGLLIATASADQTIRVWNTKSGNQVSTHRGLSSPATSIAWAANGEYLLAGDDRGNVVEFPFSATRKGATMRTGFFSDAHGDVIYDEADKNLLVTASTNRIDIVDISSLSTIDSISNYFQAIRCQSNKITLIKSDFSIHEIESESKRPIRSSPTIDNAFSPKFFSLSPSQRYFAVTGDSGKICLLDLDSFSSLNLQDPESNTVWTCTFSFDSKELWTGNMSGQIRRWEIETGQLLPTQITAEGDITSIALSPDDRWVAAALYEKSSVQIYDRVKDTWISHSLKHRRFVQSLLFTKKGDRLISGGADGRIVYWSTPDFDEIAAFEVESTPEVWGDEGVATLKISPKEDGMAALTEDGRLAVWHTR
jgi:WD40 repeat protein